jgi:ferritin
MLSEKMQKALNGQINAEFYSSFLYLAMAAYLIKENWNGFASWMEKQSVEEYGHAMKFYKYLANTGSPILLEVIEKPRSEWKSPLEIFEESLKHEKYVTGKINDLVNQAISEKDHATGIFLQWFVTEQVEEEATVDNIISKFKFLGDNKSTLYMLDKELGSR